MATATYADLASLYTNTDFINRINLAIVHYAQYIIGTFTSQNPKKIAWAWQAVNEPDQWVPKISRIVEQASIFTSQNTGLGATAMLAAIIDSDFQAAVETAINTTILA